MDKDILAEKLAAHNHWWVTEGREGERFTAIGCDLKSANLRGANLQEADLHGVDLRGVDLQGSKLRSADLRSADLQHADLQGADLRRANLQRAKMVFTDVKGANFVYAALQKAYVVDVVLSDRPLPMPIELLRHLSEHVKSSNYIQRSWCGKYCGLSGAAGQLIRNQYLGVVLIAQLVPEFNLNVLYSPDRDRAIAELERCLALYKSREV
jgi:hypothetical protein